VKELLEALGIPILEVEGWEGDDILGTIARMAEESGIRALLVTGDRDALQLVSDAVHVVSTRKGITDIVVYDPPAVLERYGVRPVQVADYLGLKGDTSDNIPGVPGVGEKTAAKLIAEYGSLDAVLDAAHAIKGKLGENLTHARRGRAGEPHRRDDPHDVPLEIDLAAVSGVGSTRPRRRGIRRAALHLAARPRARVRPMGERPARRCRSQGAPRCRACERRRGVVARRGLGRARAALGVGGRRRVARCRARRRYRRVALRGAPRSRGRKRRRRSRWSVARTLPRRSRRSSASARVAAGDTKALLHELCPPVV
jgi:DNA polymerase I